MDTEPESVVAEAELPGDEDAGDQGEGGVSGDDGEAVEEMGHG